MSAANSFYRRTAALGERAERHAAEFGVRLSGDIPPPIRDAFRRIIWVAQELVISGHLKPETAADPVPYWIVSPRHYDEADDFDQAVSLYRTAAEASKTVRPLQIGSERLLDALGIISLRARNEKRKVRLEDPEVMCAFVTCRNALWMLTPSTNQALKAYIFKLDQILDQIRDRMLQILVEGLFRGEMTAEEGAKAVSVLKQAAETGQWRDPEGDLDRLEAASRPVGEASVDVGFV